MQETQDRTRKRIKEDLKESSIAYNEYADNALPKLKRNYMRKCQDVEVRRPLRRSRVRSRDVRRRTTRRPRRT